MTDHVDPFLDDELDIIAARDDETHYRGALIAYRVMLDELYDAMKELFPDADTVAMQRYKTALDGIFASRASLDRAQYKRITRIVVNEQKEVGRQLDALAGKIDRLTAGGDKRDMKLDQLLLILSSTPAMIETNAD
jgi:hypothetical protein